MATSGSSTASASMVAETAPSTEFSTGTHARSEVPCRTAASASGTVATGTSVWSGAGGNAGRLLGEGSLRSEVGDARHRATLAGIRCAPRQRDDTPTTVIHSDGHRGLT